VGWKNPRCSQAIGRNLTNADSELLVISRDQDVNLLVKLDIYILHQVSKDIVEGIGFALADAADNDAKSGEIMCQRSVINVIDETWKWDFP
jgi:hypothetical protein